MERAMIQNLIKSFVKGILPFLFLSTFFLSTTTSVQGGAYIEKIPYYSANIQFFRDILVNPKYKKK